MNPLPACATGSFGEWQVRGPGLRAFSTIWAHRLPRTHGTTILVSADGAIDLQWVDHTFRVAGPDSEAKIETFPAGTLVVGFRFRPAAASAWLGVAASEITNLRPDLESLWGARARRAADEVVVDAASEENLDGLIRNLAVVVSRVAPDFEYGDPAMRLAYELVASGASPGARLVPRLGSAVGVSERTLRRRFDEPFGYGPRTLDRVLRYQRFLRLAANSRTSTAILALEAGYADQSHFIRECRRLTGFPPGVLRRLTERQISLAGPAGPRPR